MLGRALAAVILGWSITLGAGLGVTRREMGEIQDGALADAAAMALAVLRGGHGTDAAPRIEAPRNLPIVNRAGMSGAAPWPPRTADGASRHDDWRIFRASAPSGLAVEIGAPVSERREDFIETARAFIGPMAPILASRSW